MMNAKFMFAGLLLAMSMPSQAAQTVIINNGTTDWTSSSSYSEKKVPAKGDNVRVNANCTVTVRDEASLAVVSDLNFVNLYGGNASTIVFDVPKGKAWSVNCYIRQPNGDISGGNIIKRGAGTLQLQHSEDKAYNANISVEEGVLVLPQAVNVANAYLGVVTISNGATLYMPNYVTSAGNHRLYLLGLQGAGDLVNESGLAISLCTAGKASDWVWDGATYEFSGRITGAVSWTSMKGRQLLTGVQSTMTLISPNFDTGDFAAGAGTFGVTKIGNAGEPSSIGSENYIRWVGGGGILYLGSGETTDKTLQLQEGGHPFIDGGAQGGLIFTGAINGNIDNSHGPYDKTLTLDGSNTTQACALMGALNAWKQNKVDYTFNLVKRGTGVWRLGNTASTMFGDIVVKDGTLVVDSIAERGVASSLGTALSATDGVPAMVLGGEGTEGCIELFADSEKNVYSPNRPIALVGDARFRNDSAKEFRVSDITLSGVGARTLTLDGSSTKNYIADLVEGQGTLSVVKAGSGTWHLGGDVSFSGNLSVDAGELVIPDPSKYAYYKWVIRGMASDEGTFSKVWIDKFGLFDAENRRINASLSLCGSLSELVPGSFAFDYGETTCGHSGSDVLFTNDSTPLTLFTYRDQVLTRPVPGDSNTWVTITMRLPEDSETARSWDVGCGYTPGTDNINFVGNCALYGSVDGLHFDLLAEKTDLSYSGYRYWAGSGTAVNQNSCETHANGFPIAEAVIDPLELAATVSVARGATLKAERAVTVSALEVSADGFGTLDGVTLAANGELHVTGDLPKQETTLAGTFLNVDGLERLSGWRLFVNGKASERKLSVTSSGIRIKAKGLVVIVR